MAVQRSDNRPVILGITGGVATGKSTVARFLVERGAIGVSADDVARALLAPGTQMTSRVLAHFGPNFALDGYSDRIDRAKLARHIFADESARRDLGDLMHPDIHRVMMDEIEAARRDPDCRLIAAEIPLLYENNLRSSVDAVLAVVCSEEEQAARLMARHPMLGANDALHQIRAQIPTEEKARLSDFVIVTSRPIERVKADAGELYDRLIADGDNRPWS
jgi:dephospho-CoA kinase